MKLTFTGSVNYADGSPAPNVNVRIFDKDAAVKDDDDLTVTPGFSDGNGRFDLTYEPLRYLDFHTIHSSGTSDESGDVHKEETGLRLPDLGDIYLPYLRFDYTFNGVSYTHTASLGIFQTKYFLPHNQPVEFLPSSHGFQFLNSFAGYFLPYSTPAFMGSAKVSSKYGLCGGMCAAAYDFILAGKTVPAACEAPKQGTRLQRYLFQRQMDSLGGLGQQIVKVAQWTSLPDDTLVGTMRRTADEFLAVRQQLDQKNLVVLALIYVHATSLTQLARQIFNNHQVLAYAYKRNADGSYTIRVYDPNLPGRDDVAIHSEPILLGEEGDPADRIRVMGLKSSEQVESEPYRQVRGFFAMPYSPVKPPKEI